MSYLSPYPSEEETVEFLTKIITSSHDDTTKVAVIKSICSITRDINETGDTALHLAVRQNKYVLARGLLRLGFDINLPNHDNHTPIFIASTHAYVSMVRLLLRFRPNLEVVVGTRRTAYYETYRLDLAKAEFGTESDQENAIPGEAERRQTIRKLLDEVGAKENVPGCKYLYCTCRGESICPWELSGDHFEEERGEREEEGEKEDGDEEEQGEGVEERRNKRRKRKRGVY